MGRLAVLVLFGILVASGLVSAANVHGTIYNMLLEPQENVMIEVNSVPQQEFVSKGGDYSFELPKGNYAISAMYIESGRVVSSAAENISVIDDGTYVLDMILLESTDEEFDLLDVPQIDIEGENSRIPWVYIAIVPMLILISVLVWLYWKNRPVVNEPDANDEKVEPQKEDLEFLIKIIKEQGSRITQKDLRKKLSLSEAKVSLMIAELESLGKVKKIKQGRGNIIVMR